MVQLLLVTSASAFLNNSRNLGTIFFSPALYTLCSPRLPSLLLSHSSGSVHLFRPISLHIRGGCGSSHFSAEESFCVLTLGYLVSFIHPPAALPSLPPFLSFFHRGGTNTFYHTVSLPLSLLLSVLTERKRERERVASSSSYDFVLPRPPSRRPPTHLP